MCSVVRRYRQTDTQHTEPSSIQWIGCAGGCISILIGFIYEENGIEVRHGRSFSFKVMVQYATLMKTISVGYSSVWMAVMVAALVSTKTPFAMKRNHWIHQNGWLCASQRSDFSPFGVKSGWKWCFLFTSWPKTCNNKNRFFQPDQIASVGYGCAENVCIACQFNWQPTYSRSHGVIIRVRNVPLYWTAMFALKPWCVYLYRIRRYIHSTFSILLNFI